MLARMPHATPRIHAAKTRAATLLAAPASPGGGGASMVAATALASWAVASSLQFAADTDVPHRRYADGYRADAHDKSGSCLRLRRQRPSIGATRSRRRRWRWGPRRRGTSGRFHRWGGQRCQPAGQRPWRCWRRPGRFPRLGHHPHARLVADTGSRLDGQLVRARGFGLVGGHGLLQRRALQGPVLRGRRPGLGRLREYAKQHLLQCISACTLPEFCPGTP